MDHKRNIQKNQQENQEVLFKKTVWMGFKKEIEGKGIGKKRKRAEEKAYENFLSNLSTELVNSEGNLYIYLKKYVPFIINSNIEFLEKKDFLTFY